MQDTIQRAIKGEDPKKLLEEYLSGLEQRSLQAGNLDKYNHAFILGLMKGEFNNALIHYNQTNQQPSLLQAWQETKAKNEKLREALDNLMASQGGGTSLCGHEHHCSCPWDLAKEALKL